MASLEGIAPPVDRPGSQSLIRRSLEFATHVQSCAVKLRKRASLNLEVRVLGRTRGGQARRRALVRSAAFHDDVWRTYPEDGFLMRGMKDGMVVRSLTSLVARPLYSCTVASQLQRCARRLQSTDR